uniref:Protein crowded nuclei 4-like n=1 Tax=Tanacetum cinerariifolium TaxID=118510 RepID=A0A6L2M7I0_TANCI|nr:protein crowded nuclei 4-like [Tanacetum cinerariifolium]
MAQEKYVEGTTFARSRHDEKKQLGKGNEDKMTLYNALPRKEYETVFMCKTADEVCHTLIITHQGNSQVKNYNIDLLTQEYEKFSISNEDTIDIGFTRFIAILTSLFLDLDYSRKNHIRKFLRALPLKWKAKVYEMVWDNDGVAFKTTKEKVKSLALKSKVTREQTSNDSDSQKGSDKMFGRGRGNIFGNKGGERSRQKGVCYNCGIEGYFANKPTKGLIYLNSKNEKRFMNLEELSKFCDATLEKVLNEVKLKIFETEFLNKAPLLESLDLMIMKTYKREIKKCLSHSEQMRRCESFVNGRLILRTMRRQ